MPGTSNIPASRRPGTLVSSLLAFAALGAFAGCRSDATGPGHTGASPVVDPSPAFQALPLSIDVRVSAGSDDAEERADGSMSLTSSDLELVYDGGDQTVGMRFTGVAVPQGASITAAHVQFQVDERGSQTTVLTIEGEATDDAATFGSANRGVSSRSRTSSSASVSWEPVAWTRTGQAGSDQQTPDISAIIQEIVSRPGWSSGNALVLIVTGTGKRTAEAYDGVPSAAPLLHIEYVTAPAASVEVTPGAATIGQGSTLQLTATPRDAAGDPLPRAVTWSSGAETIATVSPDGLVTGIAAGTATITAEADGVSGSAAISVFAVEVASVEVEPASATIATGATIQLTATPKDAQGDPLPGRPVTWSSSNEGVAVVSDGLVTGVAEGTVTVTATSEGHSGASSIDVFVPPPGTTAPNLKVAFIGDAGSGGDAIAVLQLIGDEAADMVIHSGDLDYENNPALFDGTVTSVLGADFPYFVSVGNHDDTQWYGPGGYQDRLQQRLDLIPGARCTGDLGVNSWCTYQGLFFVLSGIGTLGVDSEAEAFIRSALEADASDWRICSWHKNQAEMQVGGKGSSVGWVAYETCLEQGAIIATGHEHSYSRTKTLTSTQVQIVDPAWPDPGNLSVRPGATFAFVSGLGGKSIREQLRCLPTTYPYGCNGEWASIYTSSQAAQSGALFIEFYVDGNPRKARGYFKNVSGQVIDQFTVWSGSPSGPSNASPVVTVGGDAGGDEGATVNVTATFTDADVADTHTGTIDWGDASVPEGGTVTEAGGAGTVDGSHAYADDGVYTVTITVNDGRGGVASDSRQITVVNVDPVADAGGPYPGVEGSSVSFSGGATDPGNDTFTFEWDFGDGNTGSGAAASHTYAADGDFIVRLTVTDDDGGSGMATTTATVADADPAAAFTFSPAGPSVGVEVSFTDASASYDGIVGWEWDLEYTEGLEPTAVSTDQNPLHTYASAGTYTVRLTVREADGDVSSVDQQVVVSQEPVNTMPTASGVAITGTARVGEQLTGVYTYDDAEGDVEDTSPSGSRYRWLRNGGEIGGATTTSYTLVGEDEGALIVFEVTPVSAGGDSGTPVQSPAVGPVAGAPLAVEAISPETVDAGSFIDVDITGSGFAPGVAVTLENGSGPAPKVSNVVRVSYALIRATVTARSGGPRRDRPWDVRVTNPDGTSVVVPGGIIVSVAR